MTKFTTTSKHWSFHRSLVSYLVRGLPPSSASVKSVMNGSPCMNRLYPKIENVFAKEMVEATARLVRLVGSTSFGVEHEIC